ncbi:MAG: hypothetical protein LBE91_10420 [Tannerella sp.]|jgi:hypothetical protein|nr:hypothetical protein [Tannerella sp.]
MKIEDTMRKLFAQLPEEQLPPDFNRNMMEKIRLEAVKRAKVEKLKNILGYVLGGVIMVTAAVLAFYFTGFKFQLPEFDLPDFSSLRWTFAKPDWEVLKSPSFLFSFYIGALALLLLVADSMLRRRYHKSEL